MPRRRRMLSAMVVCTAAVFGVGCGDERDDVAVERAEQARQAALEAGLDADVADFLGLLARGRLSTYRVTYPGTEDGTELVVRNRPPDRRVDLVVAGEIRETRLVVDGAAYVCERTEASAEASCERTDALVEPPGLFTERSLETLTESLRTRRDDFTFEVEPAQIAGVEAQCLVTRVRADRARSELGDGGSICASPQGAILRVDQQGESLEATDHTTEVDPDAFTRPDTTP